MIYINIIKLLVSAVKSSAMLLACSLFVSSMVVQTVAAAQLHKVYREVFDNQGLPMVISFFKQTQDKPIVLKRVDNKIEGAVDAESALLSDYYQKMITGDVSNVAGLYYEQDGSRERFLQKLRELPTRYDGYSKLTSVYISDQYGWGPFQIVTLRLEGKDGLSLNWREAIICKKDACQLSNAIDMSDGKFNLYGIYARKKPSQISQSELKSVFEKHQSEFWLPENASAYTGFKQYPVAVSTGVSSTVSKSFELAKISKQNSLINGYDLYPMLDFLQAIQSIGKDFVSLPNENIDQQKIISQLDVLIKQYTYNDSNGYEFNLVSKFNSEQGVNVEWYQPVAAIQRITNWNRISILGFSNIKNHLVVYYQPERGLEGNVLIEPVQFFILRKSIKGKWLVVLESDKGQFAHLFDDQVMDSIQQQYGKKISFIYADPK